LLEEFKDTIADLAITERCALSRSTIFLFPYSVTTSTSTSPKLKKAGPNQKRSRQGISLRALRTNYIAVYVVVELAIIEGTRSTLRRGHIKSAFLMYFYLYIFLNVICLLKL
jgi:hypothetical protein